MTKVYDVLFPAWYRRPQHQHRGVDKDYLKSVGSYVMYNKLVLDSTLGSVLMFRKALTTGVLEPDAEVLSWQSKIIRDIQDALADNDYSDSLIWGLCGLMGQAVRFKMLSFLIDSLMTGLGYY